MEEDTVQNSPQESMSVSEAAAFLGVTEDAVRKRIHRGKIRYERDEGGHYIVYPTGDDIRQTVVRDYVQSESSALISELRAQIGRLEDQLEQANERDRENRRLLAAALERIPPQLEAPQTSEDAPGAPADEPVREEPRPEESVPWWRRILR